MSFRLLLVSGAVLLAALLVQRGEAASAPPALYTKAQARQGHAVFENNCASCHGHQLEGRVGPALKGGKFASVKAGFTIGQIFEFLSVEMPASAPGSLTRRQYVEVMAFLLEQNGYPAGNTALTDRIARGSAVALLYRPSGKSSSEVVKQGASAEHAAKIKLPPAPRSHSPPGKPLVALVGSPGG